MRANDTLINILGAIALACLLLAGTACGGGEAHQRQRLTLAWYGDSITADGGQAHRISAPAFDVQDFSVGGKHSDSPLDPGDTADVVVLRYGMADAAHGLTPAMTRANVLNLLALVQAQGRRAIVINVSATPTGLEADTNAALADITDIDVSAVPVVTLDGIHPDEASYARLATFIHAELVRLLLKD